MTIDNPQTRRRWFQFRLRTVLVLITLSCTVFEWLGQRYRHAEQQRRVARTIIELDGYVDYEVPPHLPWLSGILGEQFSDMYVSKILSHDPWTFVAYGPSPMDIDCKHSQITDADLELLQNTPKLKTLYLDHAKEITDDGLKCLRGLTHLEKLVLRNSKVTDAGLENLYGLTALREIDLWHTQVTNEGCRNLQQALPKVKIRR